MADLDELVEELTDEVQGAGFSDFGVLADVLQRLADNLADRLDDQQAEALDVAVEILCALDKSTKA